MKILYFTATGNSLYVAKRIGGELFSIPQMIKEGKYDFKDDSIGIVCPIYGFTPPKLVKRFLKRVEIDAKYGFVVGTYGCRYGYFGEQVTKIFKKRRINLDYVNAVKMVDTAVVGFKIKEQLATLKEKQVDKQLDVILNDIKVNKRRFIYLKTEERKRAFIHHLLNPLSSILNGSKTLSIDEKCTKCGTCEKVCPVKAITINDTVKISSRCESCLACLHNCPSKAIHQKMEKSGERYRNEEITLNEIIESNNQL